MVILSGEPRRTVVVFRCFNWTPDVVYCPGEDAYLSILNHGNDDIEYYEYDNDDDKNNADDDDDDKNNADDDGKERLVLTKYEEKLFGEDILRTLVLSLGRNSALRRTIHSGYTDMTNGILLIISFTSCINVT